MARFWCGLFALLLLGVIASGCPTEPGDGDAGQDADQQQDGDGEECRIENCTPPENATAVCTQGECDFVCDSGYTRSGEQCEACTTEDHCGPECLPCETGMTCCTDTCYDLLTDPAHCGTCDNTCASLDYTCCEGKICCTTQ